MSLFSASSSSRSLSQVSNYSGEYIEGNDYRQFDFVYNSQDGKFYYAKEDVVDGAGIVIQDSNRISFVPGEIGQTNYILDTWNQPDQLGSELKVGHLLNVEGSTLENDGVYRILDIQKDLLSLNNDPTLTGAAIKVASVDGQMNNKEIATPYEVTLSVINASLSDNSNSWESDVFFFDADYGSTVSFRANNYKYEFGNGYYIYQPKNINSLTCEVDLQFKNITNRESNAIVHFLENHQGQHEQDMPSPNLKYSQGISGFRWGGSSSFHPYDNTQVQTKKFFCNEWSHSLNFENSNDIKLKLRNIDSSLLNKNAGLFVGGVNEYSDSVYYEKNDVVFNSENKRHYYWSGDSSTVGVKPTEPQESWSRKHGYHKDINTQYWTREFFWKPSIGLNIDQKPRMNEISVGAGYTQTYKDGINESLLNFELSFNNRDEAEARAILHFLEQHYGCIPFVFRPPAPYEKEKNFVCQEWSHTYNHKNNHSISARFEQFPFSLSASQYDNIITPSAGAGAELSFSSPVLFNYENSPVKLKYNEKLRHRLVLKNIGDANLQIYNVSIASRGEAEFKIIGADIIDVPIVQDAEQILNYVVALPPDYSLPFNLANKTVRIKKNFTSGPDGGFFFDQIAGDQVQNKFFQNNRGHIIKLMDGQSSEIDKNKHQFVHQYFIANNASNIIEAGGEAYLDLEFMSLGETDLSFDIVYRDDDGEITQLMWQRENETFGGSLRGNFSEKYFYGDIIIESNSLFGEQQGLLKIYLNR